MAQAAQHETTIELPPLARAASFQPGTVDQGKRTVDMTWTTGARVLRGYYNRYWEQLSLDPSAVRMGRLNNGAPVLNAHDDYDAMSVVGVVERASIGTEPTATVRFAKAEDSPEADQIFRLVADGILQKTSVGYQVYRMEPMDGPDGSPLTIDGVPVMIATDWEPFELSVVPIGADDGAGFRAADKRAPNKCVFVTRQQQERTKKMAIENEGTPNIQPASGKPQSAAIEATRAAAAARIEDAKQRSEEALVAAEKATRDERERVSEIRDIAKRSGLGHGWADILIEKGTPANEARIAAFDAMAADGQKTEIQPYSRVTAEEDQRDKFIRGASAWILERSGMNQMVRDAMKARPEMFAGQKIEFDGGEFRGLSPIELARMSLQRNNVDTRGWNTMKMVGEAFVHRGGSVQTAGDFPILLENVLNKVLLGAYALQSNTWEKFTTSVDVADFRTQKRYRTGSLGALDVIGEHGEYRNGIVPDGSSYGILTKRMGKIFGLSQETIINDDMGALVDQAKQLGQSAMRSIEIAVYALLTANGGLGATFGSAPFFDDATRKNINTTGSALSVFGIDADRVVMQNQKDPNNQDFIDLQPAVLLVPNTLKGTALEVNENQFDFDASGTVSGNSTGKFMRTNRVRGLFKEVVATPRLTGTRRYLFADTMDAIVVAWLQGFGRGPVLESQSGWRVSGVEWKVTVYANPQFGDPKAAVTNAGA